MSGRPKPKKVIYDIIKGRWDLTGEEYFSGWPLQTQVWYRCDLGLFVLTIAPAPDNSRWISTHRFPAPAMKGTPQWHGKDITDELLDYLTAHHGAVPVAPPSASDEFDQEDIEAALEYAK